VYVDDIIFGSNNNTLCEEFVTTMQGEIEMSMMGELTYFLGPQVKQLKNGTFLNQSKFCFDLLKKFRNGGLQGSYHSNCNKLPYGCR